MALSTRSLTSTTAVTRTHYQPTPVHQTPVKSAAQKEQESPTLTFPASNDLGQPNIDGTGASFSILV